MEGQPPAEVMDPWGLEDVHPVEVVVTPIRAVTGIAVHGLQTAPALDVTGRPRCSKLSVGGAPQRVVRRICAET